MKKEGTKRRVLSSLGLMAPLSAMREVNDKPSSSALTGKTSRSGGTERLRKSSSSIVGDGKEGWTVANTSTDASHNGFRKSRRGVFFHSHSPTPTAASEELDVVPSLAMELLSSSPLSVSLADDGSTSPSDTLSPASDSAPDFTGFENVSQNVYSKMSSLTKASAIGELVLTEKAYTGELLFTKKLILIPLRESQIIDRSTISSLFLNWKQLVELHKELSRSLMMDYSLANVANVFEKFVPAMIDIYGSYLRGYDKSAALLDKLIAANPRFAEIATSTPAELEGLHLRNIIVKPVQRICKYELLLRAVIREAEKNIPPPETGRNRRRVVPDDVVRASDAVDDDSQIVDLRLARRNTFGAMSTLGTEEAFEAGDDAESSVDKTQCAADELAQVARLKCIVDDLQTKLASIDASAHSLEHAAVLRDIDMANFEMNSVAFAPLVALPGRSVVQAGFPVSIDVVQQFDTVADSQQSRASGHAHSHGHSQGQGQSHNYSHGHGHGHAHGHGHRARKASSMSSYHGAEMILCNDCMIVRGHNGTLLYQIAYANALVQWCYDEEEHHATGVSSGYESPVDSGNESGNESGAEEPVRARLRSSFSWLPHTDARAAASARATIRGCSIFDLTIPGRRQVVVYFTTAICLLRFRSVLASIPAFVISAEKSQTIIAADTALWYESLERPCLVTVSAEHGVRLLWCGVGAIESTTIGHPSVVTNTVTTTSATPAPGLLLQYRGLCYSSISLTHLRSPVAMLRILSTLIAANQVVSHAAGSQRRRTSSFALYSFGGGSSVSSDSSERLPRLNRADSQASLTMSAGNSSYSRGSTPQLVENDTSAMRRTTLSAGDLFDGL